MDIFNRKKLKLYREQSSKYFGLMQEYRSIIKLLVDEPDCKKSILLRKLIKEQIVNNRWNGLTRETHLGWFDLDPGEHYINKIMDIIKTI